MSQIESYIGSTNTDAVISSVIQTVYQSLDIDEVFQEIVRTLGIYLQADRCFIARFSEESAVLSPPTKEYRSSNEIESILDANPERWVILAEMAKQICHHDVPVELSELEPLPPIVQAQLDNMQVQSVLACTIRFQNKCQAVLIIQQVTEKREWKDFEKEMVHLISIQSAIAIHHAELYEEVQNQSRRQTMISHLYMQAIRGLNLEELFNLALEISCQTLSVEFGKIIEKTDAPQKPYLFRAVRGFKPSLAGQQFEPGGEPHANFTLETMVPIVVTDIHEEKRFSPSPLHVEYGLISGVTAVIYGDHKPFGVLQVDSQGKRTFSKEDVFLMQSVANIIGLVVERKEAEEALRKNEERLSLVLEATNDGVWDWDFKNDTAWWNPQYTQIIGTDIPEAERSLHKVTQYIHPDDRDVIPNALKAHIEQGKKYEFELRFVHPSGEIRHGWAKGKTLLDAQGNIERMAGTLTDITERRKAERALLEYQKKLEQSNRELEQFATVASHDLKAPLRKISTFSSALEQVDGSQLSLEGQDYLKRIRTSVDKMQAMVIGLLALSSITRQGKPFRPVHLRDVIIEVLADLEPYKQEVNGSVEIGELCVIDGDESQLNQMFQNLIGNALKFHRPNTPPIVKIDSHQLQNGQCAITVQDNGIGFKQEYTDKIFDLFERLPGNQAYEGTGIGLALVKKIAERHGGSVTVESILGQGTTFTVTLPTRQA